MKQKYRYNLRTWLWGILLVFTSILAFEALIGDGLPLEGLIFLCIVIWRFVVNRRKCRNPEVQAELQKKKVEKHSRIERSNTYVKQEKPAQIPKTKKIKTQPHHTNVTTNNTGSSFGKKAAMVGLATGYTGARVIYSLTKPYMGGKKRRSRRRRKRW